MIIGVVVFYAWLAFVVLRSVEKTGELTHGSVHV